LTGLEKVFVAVGYKLASGKSVSEFPSDADLLAGAEPITEELPGWKEPLGDLREYSELPANAQRYVERVEQLVGVESIAVSVGAERAQTIVRKNPFRRAQGVDMPKPTWSGQLGPVEGFAITGAAVSRT